MTDVFVFKRTEARKSWRAHLLSGALASVMGMTSPAWAAPECTGEPLFITAECTDPRFHTARIDTDEERTDPVPHRFVSGHFQGTDARFAYYFPLDGYQQRFFQFTHQLLSSENASEAHIRFAIDSGAYLVQSNMGGREAIRTAEAGPIGGLDPTVAGYRVNAAAARHSREVAAQIYGEHRPYGYLSGGSGGALQTIAGMQNTTVWDGAVPYIQPSPQATPNVYTVRIHALRVLRDGEQNRFPDILDAIDPGGSGDPYATLNTEQREALAEATRLGFPMRGWFDYPTMTVGALRFVAAYVPILDPEYFHDFWEVEGYLGHDDPYGSVARSVVYGETDVAAVHPAPQQDARLVVPQTWVIALDEPPEGRLPGAELKVLSGAAEGSRLTVLSTIQPGVVVAVGDASQLTGGDRVLVNNRDYLALQSYHRHQVPDKERYERATAGNEHFPPLPEVFPHFAAWDQFLADGGTPLYPQRDKLLGPATAYFGAGSLQSGKFHGKMIGLQTMMDIDAFPWMADWYRTQIHMAGNSERYRLYYIDHADHGVDVSGASGAVDGGRQARLVSFRGALEQAILELVDWVENESEPPSETHYTMDGAQVILPSSASERRGIQPVVHLQVNGAERTDIAPGETVTLRATAEVPPEGGKVVQVEWDPLGKGEFTEGELNGVNATVEVATTHAYSEPGVYFPVVRITSHRQGLVDASHARVQNIARARVVVE